MLMTWVSDDDTWIPDDDDDDANDHTDDLNWWWQYDDNDDDDNDVNSVDHDTGSDTDKNTNIVRKWFGKNKLSIQSWIQNKRMNRIHSRSNHDFLKFNILDTIHS